MSAPIFISFASKDHAVAETICSALEKRGFGCWISSRNIDPGDNFQTAIVHAIRSAKVMILVFSANSNNSDEIKKELALASQSHLVVIPVRVEDVTPDEAFAYEFATRQWIDAFDDWERSIGRLAELLSRAGGLQPDAAVSVDAIPQSPRRDAPPAQQPDAPMGRSEALPRGASRNRYSRAILAVIGGGGAIAIAAAAILLGIFKGAEPPGSPSIVSVSAIQARPDQTIVVSGRGFGEQAPYVGNSEFVRVGVNNTWFAGSTRDPGGNLVTLAIGSWSNSKIVLDGFSGQYGQRGWTLKVGDPVEFQIWNPQTKAGPARFTVTVTSNDAAPAPPAIPLELGVDRPGSDLRYFDLPIADPVACSEACRTEGLCRAFTYVKPGIQASSARCWLKSSIPSAQPSPCCISGVK
jgi:hypothetical protein